MSLPFHYLQAKAAGIYRHLHPAARSGDRAQATVSGWPTVGESVSFSVCKPFPATLCLTRNLVGLSKLEAASGRHEPDWIGPHGTSSRIGLLIPVMAKSSLLEPGRRRELHQQRHQPTACRRRRGPAPGPANEVQGTEQAWMECRRLHSTSR